MRGRTLSTVLLPCVLCGCGTAINLAPTASVQRSDQYWSARVGPKRAVYGGVALDLDVAGRSVRNFREHPRLAAVFLPASLIDLPFSAIGDTLTLPLTINGSTADNYDPQTQLDVERHDTKSVLIDVGNGDIQIVEGTGAVD